MEKIRGGSRTDQAAKKTELLEKDADVRRVHSIQHGAAISGAIVCLTDEGTSRQGRGASQHCALGRAGAFSAWFLLPVHVQRTPQAPAAPITLCLFPSLGR